MFNGKDASVDFTRKLAEVVEFISDPARLNNAEHMIGLYLTLGAALVPAGTRLALAIRAAKREWDKANAPPAAQELAPAAVVAPSPAPAGGLQPSNPEPPPTPGRVKV